MIIWLGFTDYVINLWIKPYPERESTCYMYTSDLMHRPKLKLKACLIFQKIAKELPKIIASIGTESFYDKTKQKQIEFIPVLELAEKIEQAFTGIRKAVLTAEE